MSKMQVVRALVAERLAAAAEEIFGSVQRMKTQKKKLLTSGLLTRHFNVTSLRFINHKLMYEKPYSWTQLLCFLLENWNNLKKVTR